MPDEFKTVLPPLQKTDTPNDSHEPNNPDDPEEIRELPIGSCWGYPNSGNAFKYVGPANTLDNIEGYFEPTCTVSNGTDYNLAGLVFANSRSDAEAICATLATFNVVQPFSAWVPNTPSNSYLCWVNAPAS